MSNVMFFDADLPAPTDDVSLSLKNYKQEEDTANHTLHIMLNFQVTSSSLKLFLLCYQLDYSYSDNDDRKPLTPPVILAHAIPFVRELVANLTIRTRNSSILLPPVNTYNLFKDYLNNIQPTKKDNN